MNLTDEYFIVLNRTPTDALRRMIDSEDASMEQMRNVLLGMARDWVLLSEKDTERGRQQTYRVARCGPSDRPAIFKINLTKKPAPDGEKLTAFFAGAYFEEEGYSNALRRLPVS